MKRKVLCLMPLVLLLSLIFMGGCGGPTVHQVEVKGKISLDGKPLTKGSICFVSESGDTPTGGGTILEDGTYIAKVPPGSKKVLVTGYKVIGSEPERPGVANSPMIEKRVPIVPGIYNAKTRTPLSANITESQEGLDFQLVSNP